MRIVMGKMILCRTKKAKKPLIVKGMGVCIYTLEELCYLIYNNVYVIGDDFFDEELLEFIESTGETELADRIAGIKSRRAGLAELVVTVLKYVDYYTVEEIEELKDILETLTTKNVYERLKVRGDAFLERRSYFGAIKSYSAIIDGKPDASLSGLFYAKVYHNMGVAHAGMFLYRQAAAYFDKAYKIGQHEESKKCFMAAKRLAEGEQIIELDDADEEEYVLKREIETLMDNARYSDEYRRLQDIEKIKDGGDIDGYYRAVSEILDEWKRQYISFTSAQV